MGAYVYPNFKTKKALKEAVAKGEKVECMENTPWASQSIIDGEAFIEGPHYPKPHTWYGKAVVEGGYIVKVT